MQIVLWNGTDEINIPELRKQGCLIFLCSEEPYFYAYKKYFRYVNGFITNKGHFAHMGCCEVLVDLPHKHKNSIIKKSFMEPMLCIVLQAALNIHL